VRSVGVGLLVALGACGRIDFDPNLCGLFGSGMYCWGDNDYGQLGIGEQAIAVRPVVVPFP